MKFKLKSQFQPTGDQPLAIEKLAQGLNDNQRSQVLLGVTGSGKTFTLANVIEKVQLPTLVIAHNKTLAAQLYQEFRDFFPDNAVSYFVSYYDYYQPEAYLPSSDTYIEKEATINEELDKLRLSATTNLITRPDTIVVSSVSCIYNLGSPVEYAKNQIMLSPGEVIKRDTLFLGLASLQYDRSDTDLLRGTFRVRGEQIQIWPAYSDEALVIEMTSDVIEKIYYTDPISQKIIIKPKEANRKIFTLYPAKHYVVDQGIKASSISQIREDLKQRTSQLIKENRTLEAYRLEQKVNFDLEMIESLGFVNGIENYSRYFDGRKEGDPPYTLLDYFRENTKIFGQKGFLTLVDESHMTVPQIRGMFNGDRSRKQTLINYGFRLPSALDNRPLKFEEFLDRTDQVIYTSATPSSWEISEASGHIVEQLIRPTGLVDPPIFIRQTQNQIEDLVIEIINSINMGQRVLVTTLTKKMAEVLTDYLNDKSKIDQLIESYLTKQEQIDQDQVIQTTELPINDMEIGPIDRQLMTKARLLVKIKRRYPQVAYLHSDIETLKRSDILDDLREGKYDVLVGINLLREGLDLPEVSLVAILDSDKEGFLRSDVSIIQTIGRAARHLEGRAILYADNLTGSLKRAIGESLRRRVKQLSYNREHQITPSSISKKVREKMVKITAKNEDNVEDVIINLSKKERVNLEKIKPDSLTPFDKDKLIKKLTLAMKRAARDMDFETAAVLRDKIVTLQN